MTAPIDFRSHLHDLLTTAIATVAPGAPVTIGLERPKQAQHGDYASTVALQLAKLARANPRELASRILAALPPSPWLESAEVAGAGFINLRLTAAANQEVIRQIHAGGFKFG